MRSTVNISELIEEVNRLNRESVKLAPDLRHGWNVLLENILHKAGAYAGFGHYRQDELPETELAGIVWLSPDGKKLDRWQEDAVPSSRGRGGIPGVCGPVQE